MDILRIMTELGRERYVFHSEADFQHSLAWKIKEIYPKARVRLEVKLFYPPITVRTAKGTKTKRRSLDVLVNLGSNEFAIELKYKTAKIDGFKIIRENDENFQIPREGAQDIARYGYLSDLMRLEKQTHDKSNRTGHAILLTNDSSYWNPPTKKKPKDIEFRIHKDFLKRRMNWQDGTSEKTTKGRTKPIVLKKKYPIKWRPYSKLVRERNKEFRYLLISTE